MNFIENLLKYTPVASDRINILIEQYKNKIAEEKQKKQEEEEYQKKLLEEKQKEEKKRKLWEEELQKKLEAAKVEDEIEQKKFERVLKEKELEHKLNSIELQKLITEERLKEKRAEESKEKFNEMLLTILSAKEKSTNMPLILILTFFGVSRTVPGPQKEPCPPSVHGSPEWHCRWSFYRIRIRPPAQRLFPLQPES